MAGDLRVATYFQDRSFARGGGTMYDKVDVTADLSSGRHNKSNPDRLGMIITPERVVYRGLLGAPSCRALGSLTVYVAQQTPFEIRRENGSTERGLLAVAPPNSPHEIRSADRVIGVILIEPECATIADVLPVTGTTTASRNAEYAYLHRAFMQWRENDPQIEPTKDDVDRFFFGRVIAPLRLDERIERVVRRIRAQPCDQFLARDCARLTGLSFSRFVHLFKDEIGMTFRAFCAWKRARAVLPHVTSPGNLTDLAFRTGYPDSTHFSHSMRRIYGLRPKDILSGSRQLALRYDFPAGDVPDVRLAGPTTVNVHARAQAFLHTRGQI